MRPHRSRGRRRWLARAVSRQVRGCGMSGGGWSTPPPLGARLDEPAGEGYVLKISITQISRLLAAPLLSQPAGAIVSEATVTVRSVG